MLVENLVSAFHSYSASLCFLIKIVRFQSNSALNLERNFAIRLFNLNTIDTKSSQCAHHPLHTAIFLKNQLPSYGVTSDSFETLFKSSESM